MKLLFVFSVMLLLCCGVLQTVAQCVCTADYRPVCGVNGRTYGNKCSLNCAKVKMAHNGKC